jgi:hypothetical protein
VAPPIDILRHGLVRDRRAPADERLGGRAGVEGSDEDSSDSYAFAEPAVAKETRTCVYDRANLGRSGPVPGPRGLLELVGDLERLVKTAQIPGPPLNGRVGTARGPAWRNRWKVLARHRGCLWGDGKLSSKGSRPNATTLELGADAQNPRWGEFATFGESNLRPSAHLQKVSGSRPSEMPANERLWERPDGAPFAGPRWVHTDADALADWRDEKGLQIVGFPEAAEGIRTLDLLHGKQLLLDPQGDLFPLWERLRGESSGDRGLWDSALFAGSFRSQSGLNPNSRLRPPDQQPMRIIARVKPAALAKPS